jgi:hypothetical protein
MKVTSGCMSMMTLKAQHQAGAGPTAQAFDWPR